MKREDFSKFFDQYLRTAQIPTLLWSVNNGKVSVQFTNCIKGFKMPLQIPVAKAKYAVLKVEGNKPIEIATSLSSEEINKMWNKNFYIKYMEK